MAAAAISDEARAAINAAVLDAQVEYGLTTGYGYRWVVDLDGRGQWTRNAPSDWETVADERTYVLTHPKIRDLAASIRRGEPV